MLAALMRRPPLREETDLCRSDSPGRFRFAARTLPHPRASNRPVLSAGGTGCARRRRIGRPHYFDRERPSPAAGMALRRSRGHFGAADIDSEDFFQFVSNFSTLTPAGLRPDTYVTSSAGLRQALSRIDLRRRVCPDGGAFFWPLPAAAVPVSLNGQPLLPGRPAVH